MSVENVSAGLPGVARVTTPQRQVKNALISNTDNPAVQQYAQVSRFTGYLTDTPPEQTEPQQNPNTGSGLSGGGYGASSNSGGSGEQSAPVLNYGRNGSTTPVEKPNVVGQFLSVVA